MFCGNRFGDFQKSLTLDEYEKGKIKFRKTNYGSSGDALLILQ
jgi:hypothetical protein